METALFEGSKYRMTKDFRVSEIAKLIRREIRDCVKAGVIPAYKYSVRTDHGSMCSSIVISINTLGQSIEDRAFVAALKAIGNQYNYDNSDATTDYFENRFFFRVQLGGGRGL